MVLFRYDHCTTHHNPQLALQRLRWKEKLQVIAEDLTSMTFHCKFGFWEHLLRMFQYWAQPQFFAINTSLPQNLPCLNNISSPNIVKKHDLYQNMSKICEGKKTCRQFPLSSLTPPQSGTFPTTSRQVNSLALRWFVPSELTQLCWVIRLEFCLKVPHMWKKKHGKRYLREFHSVFLVSGGVASFCKVYRSNSQRYQNRAYPHSHKHHKTSFRLHDESVG